MNKPYELTDSEIEHLNATALGDNPHWQTDAWGLFGVMSHAGQKKLLKWLAENNLLAHPPFTGATPTKPCVLCQLLKDFGMGEKC